MTLAFLSGLSLNAPQKAHLKLRCLALPQRNSLAHKLLTPEGLKDFSNGLRKTGLFVRPDFLDSSLLVLESQNVRLCE
jgi:hypothetical protein